VIESGQFDKDEDSVLIPGAFFPVPYLWIPLMSAPQPVLNNKSFSVPLGHVVGGGSVVNGMVFLRGGKNEYAAWEELGAKGWTWDKLLPYFIKVISQSTDYTRSRASLTTTERKLYRSRRPVRQRSKYQLGGLPPRTRGSRASLLPQLLL
jgi:choline dehydrogenase-like flavoprotein